MNCKKNANSNPGEEKQLFHPESEKVVEIGLERLGHLKIIHSKSKKMRPWHSSWKASNGMEF